MKKSALYAWNTWNIICDFTLYTFNFVCLKRENCHFKQGCARREIKLASPTGKEIPPIIAKLDEKVTMAIKQFDLLSLRGWQSGEIPRCWWVVMIDVEYGDVYNSVSIYSLFKKPFRDQKANFLANPDLGQKQVSRLFSYQLLKNAKLNNLCSQVSFDCLERRHIDYRYCPHHTGINDTHRWCTLSWEYLCKLWKKICNGILRGWFVKIPEVKRKLLHSL